MTSGRQRWPSPAPRAAFCRYVAALVILTASRCGQPAYVVWQHRYDSGHEDFGNSVAVDGNSVIVGGTWRDTSVDPPMVGWQLLRYDAQGNLQWHRVYSRRNPDWLSAVAVGADHDIVSVGYTASDTGADSTRLLLVKFSPQGDVRWDREYAFGLITQGMALSLDSAGGITVCGTVLAGGDSADEDMLLAQFDPEGNLLGRDTLNFGADESDQDLVRDRDGDFLIVGEQMPLPDSADSLSTSDILVVKLGPDRRVKWHHIYDSGDDDLHAGAALSRDGSGHIFVGVTSRSDRAVSTHLLEYTAEGRLVEDEAYPAGPDASCMALATDRTGGVLGVGSSGPEGEQGYLGWRYVRGKFTEFLKGNGYAHGANDLANDVAVDSAGNIVITGVSDPGTDADVVTLKLELAR